MEADVQQIQPPEDINDQEVICYLCDEMISMRLVDSHSKECSARHDSNKQKTNLQNDQYSIMGGTSSHNFIQADMYTNDIEREI